MIMLIDELLKEAVGAVVEEKKEVNVIVANCLRVIDTELFYGVYYDDDEMYFTFYGNKHNADKLKVQVAPVTIVEFDKSGIFFAYHYNGLSEFYARNRDGSEENLDMAEVMLFGNKAVRIISRGEFRKNGTDTKRD